MIDDACGVAFGIRVGFGLVVDLAGDAECVGVERGLGNEAVREGNAEKAGDAGRETEEEEVPVEACGFAEGKFGALGYQRGYYGRVSVIFEKEK